MNASAIPVEIPLLNTNEPDARLASLNVSEGQAVHPGDLLCTLETTKASADILAETHGFIVGLNAQEGQLLRAGDILCYISPEKDWVPETRAQSRSEFPAVLGESPGTAGLRITRPALRLAQESGIDLARLPAGPLITEKTVREYLRQIGSPGKPPKDIDPAAIIVYGGGGHGKSVIDLIRSLDRYTIHGVIDDGIPPGEAILGLPVLGGSGVLTHLFQDGIRQAVNAVGGIGDLQSRLLVFQHLKDAGFTCPSIRHPSAVVESSALLADGVQVFPQAYIGSETRLGFGVIINTGAIVSHDCQVDDYANLSPGAVLAGGVRIGRMVLVGMGATINLGVQIGEAARIGNGATVKADVPPGGIVRAGSVWPS
jgi:sugar O-acyltransferase (sialic acid O-acetyltransferase NeuD family)